MVKINPAEKGSELPRLQGGASGKAMRGIASPLPLLRIHPRPQDGVFCGIFIKNGASQLSPRFAFAISSTGSGLLPGQDIPRPDQRVLPRLSPGTSR